MKKEPAKIRDWHRPKNDECANNINVDHDCTCKRQRKPYRVVRVRDAGVGHNVRPEILIEIWPTGVLVFREKGRRMRYTTTTAKIYSSLVRTAALLALQARNAARKARRKARRK